MKTLLMHTFQDRENRLTYIGTESYFRLLETKIWESDVIARLAMYAAHFHGCVRIDHDGEQWHYLHKSAKYGTLQLTTWDDIGPVSDKRVSKVDDLSDVMSGSVKISIE